MYPAPRIDPETTLAGAAVVVAAIYFLVRWIRETEVPADPWPEEIDRAVKGAQGVSLCSNCLFPQSPAPWFCPHCDFPTGDFVPMMPYLQVFVVGEIFRRGVMGPPEKSFGQKAFLVLYSSGQYSLFAPLYWFWMWRRARGKPICTERREELILEDAP